jgi:recombination protein RecT
MSTTLPATTPSATTKAVAHMPGPNAGLRDWIGSPYFNEQVSKALPSLITPERFLRIAITATARTPKLLECTKESVMKCLLDLASFGLEPDGRRAHLIPYGKECTLILDYKGIVELVRRAGDVVTIHADVVCENDVFRHSLGQIQEHTFDLRQPRGKMYAAYAMVKLKDGSMQAAIMSRDEIEGIRKRSRAGSSGPWVTDFNEMAKKTAFRRLSKWLTLSPEIRDALERDDDDKPVVVGEPSPVLDVLGTRMTKQAENQQTVEQPAASQGEPEDMAAEARRLEGDMR